MKNFWKTALAAGVGVILVSLILTLLSTFIFGGMVASLGANSQGVKTVEPNSVLDIDFSKVVIAEQTLEDNPFAGFSSGSGFSQEEISTVGILDAVKAFENAADDPNIKLAYIRPDMAIDVAHLEELRSALVKFRESGKPLVAYMEMPTNAGYYLASAADRIYISNYHGGMNMLVGISGRLVFLKDLLDKLGVNVQLIRHGKYKSAGEMYIKNSASPENMEQNTVMVKGLWKELVTPMAERAGMSVEEFNRMIDNLELVEAEDFVNRHLADEAVDMDGMKAKLCALVGEDENNFDCIKSISLSDYAKATIKKNYKAHDRIAIVYADGGIVDGREKEEVAGKRFADIIDKVRRDDKVKAVVLRVNSPGGSVIASSQIKDAVDRLKEEKPVIASYGSYAASGGYWISAGCDYIFSDATTLTGSIGVFGMFPDFSRTAKDIAHINVTAVPSNAHSDMFALMRPLDSKEYEFFQKDIETIYAQFTALVADGRHMDVARVDELGQGRVWTGRDALAIGLVDEIGGLEAALDYAALKAGCPEYQLVSYPKPLTAMEQFMEMFEPDTQEYLVKLSGLDKATIKAMGDLVSVKEPKVFARMPYMMDIR